MKIATEFLQLHPATAAWWAQREQCSQCQHQQAREGRGDRCLAKRRARKFSLHEAGEFDYCIDARLPGGACGPDAALFKAKE